MGRSKGRDQGSGIRDQGRHVSIVQFARSSWEVDGALMVRMGQSSKEGCSQKAFVAAIAL
jgi:hypothetical protein